MTLTFSLMVMFLGCLNRRSDRMALNIWAESLTDSISPKHVSNQCGILIQIEIKLYANFIYLTIIRLTKRLQLLNYLQTTWVDSSPIFVWFVAPESS